MQVKFDNRFNKVTECGKTRKHKRVKKTNFRTRRLNAIFGFLMIIIVGGLILNYTNHYEPKAEAKTTSSVEVTKVEAKAPEKVIEKPVETIEQMITRYFPENPSKAIKIAKCESHLNPETMNTKAPDYSIGLFQINLYGNLKKTRPTEEALKDPETNIKYARGLWESAGRTFSKDWVVCSHLYNQNKLK